MKKCISILFVCLFLFACGGPSLSPFEIMSSREPHVVMVEPENGTKTFADAVVVVEFSERMDPVSVNKQNLAVVKIVDDSKTIADLSKSVADGKEDGVSGVYEFQGEGRVTVFRAEVPYESGASYAIVATNKITSLERYPLNQRPGRSPAPFVSTFTVEGAEETAPSASSRGNSPVEDSSDGSAGSSGEPDGGASIPRPSGIIIYELLYDIVGDDTDGHVFVELFGDADTDISGYKLIFVNGDDGGIYETIEFPENSVIADDGIFLVADSKTGDTNVTNVADADFIDNFDPQNGPDCVQLVSETGVLLDALGYGTPIAATAENGLACFEGASAAKVTSGKSLSRTDGADTGNNSADFTMLATPTPGMR